MSFMRCETCATIPGNVNSSVNWIRDQDGGTSQMSIKLKSNKCTGKLYNDEEQFITDIYYRLFEGSIADIWGELTPVKDTSFRGNSKYIIELQNNRKIKCCLQSCSRRPLSIPARYVYRFTGASLV